MDRLDAIFVAVGELSGRLCCCGGVREALADALLLLLLLGRPALRLNRPTLSPVPTPHTLPAVAGGGGLAAGIAAYVKALKPRIKIIGVEPSGRRRCAHKLPAVRARAVRLTPSRFPAAASPCCFPPLLY
jgi:hypothetical protein